MIKATVLQVDGKIAAAASSSDNSLRSVNYDSALARLNANSAIGTSFDGDGKFDTAVFRPAGLNWYINRSTSGLQIQRFGRPGDKPVSSAFVP